MGSAGMYVPAYGAMRGITNVAGQFALGSGTKDYQESMAQLLPMAGSVARVQEWTGNTRDAMAPYFGTPWMSMEKGMESLTDLAGVSRWGKLGRTDPKALADANASLVFASGLTKGKAKDMVSVVEAWKNSPEYKGMSDKEQLEAMMGQILAISGEAAGFLPQLIAMSSQGAPAFLAKGGKFSEFAAQAFIASEFGLKSQALGMVEKSFQHPVNIKKMAGFLLGGRLSPDGSGFMGGAKVFPDQAALFTPAMRQSIKSNPKLRHLINARGDLDMRTIGKINKAAPDMPLAEYGGLSMVQYLNQLYATPAAEGGGSAGVLRMLSPATEEMKKRGFHPESSSFANKQLLQVLQVMREEAWDKRQQEVEEAGKVEYAQKRLVDEKKKSQELADATPWGSVTKLQRSAGAFVNKKAEEYNFPGEVSRVSDWFINKTLPKEKQQEVGVPGGLGLAALGLGGFGAGFAATPGGFWKRLGGGLLGAGAGFAGYNIGANRPEKTPIPGLKHPLFQQLYGEGGLQAFKNVEDIPLATMGLGPGGASLLRRPIISAAERLLEKRYLDYAARGLFYSSGAAGTLGAGIGGAILGETYSSQGSASFDDFGLQQGLDVSDRSPVDATSGAAKSAKAEVSEDGVGDAGRVAAGSITSAGEAVAGALRGVAANIASVKMPDSVGAVRRGGAGEASNAILA
jgi:hypothetical protein